MKISFVIPFHNEEINSPHVLDRVIKYEIGEIEGKKIYLNEFLFAKSRGWIENLQGHNDINMKYYKLLPFIFTYNLFDEIFQNIDNKRLIYSIFDNENRRIFHIIDEANFLISIFLVNIKKFNRQFNKRFIKIKDNNPDGGSVSSHILSPAEPFWRHPDSLDLLYDKFYKKYIK